MHFADFEPDATPFSPAANRGVRVHCIVNFGHDGEDVGRLFLYQNIALNVGPWPDNSPVVLPGGGD